MSGKRIWGFIIVNAVVIAFFFAAPKFPLLSIAVLALLVTNLLCYFLFRAWKDHDISKIATNVGNKEVSTSIKLLRYAAAALAFISFLTTAKGLHEFVFTENDWQAYLASFAVQSILLVFNFLFFHFFVRISNLEKFPQFFKRVLIYFVVLLFIAALTVSSTFSFVFIANNTYASMRAKNSNITIEQFLKDEAYRLKAVNDDIGEALRKDITDKTKELQAVISEQTAAVASANEANINNTLANYSISLHNAVSQEFYTPAETAQDSAGTSYPKEFQNIYSSLAGYKKDYDALYSSTYTPAYNFYHGLESAANKSEYTDEAALQTQINLLSTAIGNVDTYTQKIGQLESAVFPGAFSPYKARATIAFDNLKSELQSLMNCFMAILPQYQTVAASASTSTAASTSISDILNVVYTNKYDDEEIEGIQAFLSSQQETLLGENVIDETALKNLAEFIEAFNDFAKYAELNNEIDSFTNGALRITYYIKGEDEDAVPESSGNLIVVSEADWMQERKEHFAQFISCVKLLPDVEVYKEKAGMSDFVRGYGPEKVLQSAYTLNRDLLENISGFEKALNYFKYDFSLMAVFSLIMALFLDIASFLTGGFMFAASFFNGAGKGKTPTDTSDVSKDAP